MGRMGFKHGSLECSILETHKLCISHFDKLFLRVCENKLKLIYGSVISLFHKLSQIFSQVLLVDKPK